MAEHWRPVPGWPYEVSDLGRVRRSVPGQGTSCGVLALNNNRAGGYLTVQLSQHGRQRRFFVHSLVAHAFLGAPPGPIGRGSGDYQVNHRSGVKSDNAPGNLEWLTCRENHRHAAKHGLTSRGARRHNAKLNPKKVVTIRRLLALGETHTSVAKRFGVSRPAISVIASGKTWSHVSAA